MSERSLPSGLLTVQILRYVEMRDWAQPLRLSEPFEIAPAPGEVISTLIRYLAIE